MLRVQAHVSHEEAAKLFPGPWSRSLEWGWRIHSQARPHGCWQKASEPRMGTCPEGCQLSMTLLIPELANHEGGGERERGKNQMPSTV